MINKKIVIVYPPFYRLFDDSYSYGEYPLALGYISGAVKMHTDWDVVSYNTDFSRKKYIGNDSVTFSFRSDEGYKNYSRNLGDNGAPLWNEIHDSLRDLGPSVVGISTMSQNFKSACIIAELVKSINQDILVVVGGPHLSMVGSEVLDCQHIDIGVVGEGEQTIVELLDAIANLKDLNKIDGLVFRRNGEYVTTRTRVLSQDLDKLCFPHVHAREVLKDYDLYPKSAFGNILAGRGCPYSCTFCGSHKIWGRKVRTRSPQNVVKELESLQRVGVTSVRFADDTFGLNKVWTKELCDGIVKRCRGLKWKCEVNVNLITDVFIETIKSAGCYMVELGVESGDNGILKEIKKNITVEQSLAACNVIRKHNVELQAYIIIGFPQETEDTLQKTVDAIKKIDGYIWISVFSPIKGTELYEYCLNNGLLESESDADKHYFQNLDSFSRYILRDRFRELATKIINEVDIKNSNNRMSRIFSSKTFWRIKEYGLMGSINKGLGILSRANTGLFRSLIGSK